MIISPTANSHTFYRDNQVDMIALSVQDVACMRVGVPHKPWPAGLARCQSLVQRQMANQRGISGLVTPLQRMTTCLPVVCAMSLDPRVHVPTPRAQFCVARGGRVVGSTLMIPALTCRPAMRSGRQACCSPLIQNPCLGLSLLHVRPMRGAWTWRSLDRC